MGEFKASASAMGQGQDALETAAREIEAARAELEAAYSRLQGQWQSSEARQRADQEYAAVNQALKSLVTWARAGAATTDEVNSMFARVEQTGIT